MTLDNLINILIGQEVYVEGYGFIGTTKDVKPPEVKFKQIEVNGQEIDTSLLEPMEAELEIGEYNSVIWEAISKRGLEIATFVIKKSTRDRRNQIPVYLEIGGWVKEQAFTGKVGESDTISLKINV